MMKFEGAFGRNLSKSIFAIVKGMTGGRCVQSSRGLDHLTYAKSGAFGFVKLSALSLRFQPSHYWKFNCPMEKITIFIKHLAIIQSSCLGKCHSQVDRKKIAFALFLAVSTKQSENQFAFRLQYFLLVQVLQGKYQNLMNKKEYCPLDGFNLNLKLMRSIVSKRSQYNGARLKTINQLPSLLKMKNSRIHYQTPSQAINTRFWLLSQDIDVEAMKAKIAQIKEQKVDQKTKSCNGHYFGGDFSQHTVQQYLRKAEQYASMNLMQQIMSKNVSRKKKTFKLMEIVLKQGSMYSVCQRQQKISDKNTYISVTKEIIQKYKSPAQISLAMIGQFKTRFMNDQKVSLWQILALQLQAFNSNSPLSTNISRMLISSLKLINLEFEKRLLCKDFERYVDTQYVQKVPYASIERDGLWAKVWAAYCAGDVHKVQTLIASGRRDLREIVRLYQMTEQELMNGNPTKYTYIPRCEIKDIFYQQFINCITGQARISSYIIAQNTSLELVLITLRTLGIFYANDAQQFQELKSNIVNIYLNGCLSDQNVRNMLYLLEYGTIVRMGPNELMNKYDYLHFLITLNGFPAIITEDSFKSMLTKSLVSFITQLFTQGRSEYLYYIDILPQDVKRYQIANFIFSVNGLDSFDWNGLKTMCSETQFYKIVGQTAEKHKDRVGSQLKAAIKLVQLCFDYERACSLVLTVCIKNYLHIGKYKTQDVLKAQQQGSIWAQQLNNKTLCIVFKFISQFRKLLEIVEQQDVQKIEQFIKFSEFIFLNAYKTKQYQKLFEILNLNNGLEMQFYFLRLVLKGAEIFTGIVRDNEKLSLLKAVLKELLQQQLMGYIQPDFEYFHWQKLSEELKEGNSSQL